MAFTERSAKARAAILVAATRRFASDGYERTTIRAVAADAGVDPSMVIRYFTSKADLFCATALAGAPLRVDVTPDMDFARKYAEIFVDVWEDGQSPLAALLRTAPTHADATEQLQGVLDRQFLPVFRQAFPDTPDIDRRAALVLAQTIGMVYCRYLLRLEPIASMSRTQIQHAITDVIRRYLSEPIEP